MRIKILSTIFKTAASLIVFILFSFCLTAQGFLNNGSKFIIPSGSYVFINSGDYTNTTVSSTDGTITLGGTLTADGDLTNNADGTLAISGGTVDFDGSSSQVINGSSATSFNNFTISGSGTTSLSANVTIAGDLTLSAGTFDLASYTANRSTEGGTMTVSNGATLKIGGTGTIPSNYATHSIGSTSTIEYDGTIQTITTLNSSQSYGHLAISGSGTKTQTGNITVNGNLTIASGPNLTLNAGVYLTIVGTLTLNGSECLIMKSNSSSTASLIDGGTISGSGSLKFERYLSEDKWHYFSTPIVDASSNNFWNAAMYKYNASTSAWQAITRDMTLQKMTGYDIYYADNTTATITGTPYTGSHSINLVSASNGYNFVGNPFPSAIDWDASSGWTKTNVDNAIYVWDPASSAISSYINGQSNNGGSQYIPASQGFFVTVSGGGSYVLGVDNDVRVHNAGNFRNKDKPGKSLKLKLADAESSDETIIYFDQNATELFDGQYDAYKVEESSPSRTLIFSKTKDGTALSINGLPEMKVEESIPLYLSSGSSGLKELSISGMENFEMDVNVYLEDLILAKVWDMKNGSYSFNYEAVDDQNRFLLHFAPPSVLLSGDNSMSGEYDMGCPDIPTFIQSGELILDLTQSDKSKKFVSVYSISGQLILQKEFNSNGIEKINLPGTAGCYLLHIISAGYSTIKKIVIQ